ncbi:MAG: hypothetical protein IIA64_07455 [Planctomycetes bacterium]|nr:hypothetical protein [Planctomycetota bacterium]
MTNDDPNTRSGIGDAAWAYNRWPTIGLFTGLGIGVVLSVSFPVGWIRGILIALGSGIVGCVLGLLLAKLIYGRANHRDDDQP